MIPWCGEVALSLIILCLPILLMELGANDLDDMKLIFADQLLIYKGIYHIFNTVVVLVY